MLILLGRGLEVREELRCVVSVRIAPITLPRHACWKHYSIVVPVCTWNLQFRSSTLNGHFRCRLHCLAADMSKRKANVVHRMRQFCRWVVQV